MTFFVYFLGALIFLTVEVLLISVLIESKGIDYIGDILSSAIDCFDSAYDKTVDQLIYGIDAQERDFFKWIEE